LRREILYRRGNEEMPRIETFIGSGALVVLLLAAAGTQAATLAFTDFNDSTYVAPNIKTNLNWTLNGLEDPGDMAAKNAGGGNQAIFDGNAFVQDIFIPGLNTGNGDTFWTTDVSLTVAAGFAVTVTEVTLNAVSVSGGQAENVDRRNDYTVFLLNPAAVEIDQVTVADVSAGTGDGQPLVTLDLADTVLGAGTYTLRIKGGDFAGAGETGNHTGLDNLSINGDVSVVPEPSDALPRDARRVGPDRRSTTTETVGF
jgi:hypothetical protein